MDARRALVEEQAREAELQRRAVIEEGRLRRAAEEETRQQAEEERRAKAETDERLKEAEMQVRKRQKIEEDERKRLAAEQTATAKAKARKIEPPSAPRVDRFDEGNGMHNHPVCALRSKPGATTGFHIDPPDVPVLIKLARATRPDLIPQPVRRDHQTTCIANLEFVPPQVQAILLQHFRDGNRLRRTLQQGWVRTWKGWKDAEEALLIAHDAAMCKDIALDCLHSFSRIVLDNIEIEGKTDEERIQELCDDSLSIGEGALFDCNACCADALLQCWGF